MRPGQFGLEAVAQVEEGPGQDDDVVHTPMQDNHLAGIAEACRDIRRCRQTDTGCDGLHKQILSLADVHRDYRDRYTHGASR